LQVVQGLACETFDECIVAAENLARSARLKAQTQVFITRNPKPMNAKPET
jgi:hypothetical protein